MRYKIYLLALVGFSTLSLSAEDLGIIQIPMMPQREPLVEGLLENQLVTPLTELELFSSPFIIWSLPQASSLTNDN